MRQQEPGGPEAPVTPGKAGTPGAAAVATTYIGTVVGAGFASGQEIWQFFTAFGPVGTLGILLATGLFVFFGLAALRVGSRLGARSHAAVVAVVGGRWLGRALDGLIAFFLFGALATMVAGAGAVSEDQWGQPALAGCLLLAAATVVTVWFGLNGVTGAMGTVAPLLLVATVGVSLATLLREGIPLATPAAPAAAPVPWWPASAVLYVSYNLVGAVAVLAPLGGAVTSRAALARGAALGGGGLGLAALGIHLALSATLPAAAAHEVPMLHVAGRLGPAVGLGYGAVLLAEIYTTAVASLYGLTARFASPGPGKTVMAGFRRAALVIGVASLAAGRLGFATLVGTFYPLTGLAGLTLLVLLARQFRHSS